MKIAVGVEYLGSQFSGWQYQGHEQNTIQFFVQEAISFVANQPVTIHASGRTDAGVHGLEQVCHFESRVTRTPFSWRQGANTKLPRGIRIQWAQEVPDSFHARYKALFRDYIYIIHRTAVPSAIWGGQVTSWRKPLNVHAMNQAVHNIKGEHDFSAFRAAGCQASHPVRRIMEADVWQNGDFIGVSIRGNAFLHHMIRNIVGSVLLVGEGAEKPDWIKTLLESRNRCIAGPTAPATGLYFRTTHYDPLFGIASTSKTPFGLFDRELQCWPGSYPDLDFGDRIIQ